MNFWIQVVVAGLVGAVADVIINRWASASGFQPKLWFQVAVAILIFATLLGFTIRKGKQLGQSMSIIVLVVLLVNIGALVVWDSYCNGVTLTPVQLAGFGFGILAA